MLKLLRQLHPSFQKYDKSASIAICLMPCLGFQEVVNMCAVLSLLLGSRDMGRTLSARRSTHVCLVYIYIYIPTGWKHSASPPFTLRGTGPWEVTKSQHTLQVRFLGVCTASPQSFLGYTRRILPEWPQETNLPGMLGFLGLPREGEGRKDQAQETFRRDPKIKAYHSDWIRLASWGYLLTYRKTSWGYPRPILSGWAQETKLQGMLCF